jgi:hypothetical protein
MITMAHQDLTTVHQELNYHASNTEESPAHNVPTDTILLMAIVSQLVINVTLGTISLEPAQPAIPVTP